MKSFFQKETKAKITRISIFALLLSCSYLITGCSNSECKKAKFEANQSLDEVTNLGARIDEVQNKTSALLIELCREVDSANSGNSSLLDRTFDDIWCDDWRNTGNQPPLSNEQLQSYYATLRNLEYNQSKSLQRWALTVTTYSDCFDPKDVLDAKELLVK